MIPQEDTSAGSYAAVREMELLISLGYKITFLPQDLLDTGKYTVYLEKKGIEVIASPFYLSLESFIKERGKEFDLAYINPISSHVELELNDRLNINGTNNANAVWQIHLDYLLNKKVRLSLNYLFDPILYWLLQALSLN